MNNILFFLTPKTLCDFLYDDYTVRQALEKVGAEDVLKKNGYLIVTIEELARINGVIMEPNVVYYRFINGDYSPRTDSNVK